MNGWMDGWMDEARIIGVVLLGVVWGHTFPSVSIATAPLSPQAHMIMALKEER